MRLGHVLAIDQGTTSSRALVVDHRGTVTGLGQVPFTQRFPSPGWVEHDPEEIWSSTQEAIGEALKAASLEPSSLAAVGITNQRETVVVWDRATGRPVAPAIVWQDRRTASLCEALIHGGHESAITAATGLTVDPYFSGTKLRWILDAHPGLRERAEAGEIAAGTVDSWLIWRLTGGRAHLTDFTNASRTLLFDIRHGAWDEGLCDLLRVPRSILPAVVPSRGVAAETDRAVFGAVVPIAGVAGDQQAALYGQWCTRPGLAKNTYGTGCFLLANAGRERAMSRHRLLVTLSAASRTNGPEYALEGSVFVAGAVVQWLRDEMGIVATAPDIEPLARTVDDSGGVTFVPAFTGLGAPHWDPRARGLLIGLTRGTTKGHIARAALDAIALASAELIDAMNADLPQPVTELRVDGGASRNDLLMQLQADFSGIQVVRPRETETTALGAAYLAGIGAGLWAGEDEVREMWALDRTFEPKMPEGQRLERLATWRRAVQRARDWA